MFALCLFLMMPVNGGAACAMARLSAVAPSLAAPSIEATQSWGSFRATADNRILVPRTAMEVSQPEGALAFALAHEWAHIEAGHPSTLALLLAASAQMGAGAELDTLDWELEADARALQWIRRAGYEPWSALDALDLYCRPTPERWARRQALAEILSRESPWHEAG